MMARKKIDKDQIEDAEYREERSEISVSDIRGGAKSEDSEDDFVPDAQPVMIMQEEDKEKFDMSSDDHRQKIISLKESVQSDYLEICKLLYQAQKLRRYESWNYGSFKDYAHTELGFKYARARALADLGQLAYRDPALFQTVTSVGIDKAYEIKRVATNENVTEWVEKARSVNADELKKMVRKYLITLVPKDAEEAVDLEPQARAKLPKQATETQSHSKTFQLTYENLMTINQAITVVKKNNPDILSESECLALICAEYLGSVSDIDVDGKMFAVQAISRYEQLYPVQAVVTEIEPDGQYRVLHGSPTLKKMIEQAIS